MVTAMTHRPDHALDRLLDELAAELIAAAADEIRQAAVETGHGIAAIAHEVRGVILRAASEAHEPPMAADASAPIRGTAPARWP